ncbi:hypothetical protein JCM5296_003935 [Sporobolomyces johnsonii]
MTDMTKTNAAGASPTGSTSLPDEVAGRAQARGYDETQVAPLALLWAVLTEEQKQAWMEGENAGSQGQQQEDRGTGSDDDGDSTKSRTLSASPKKCRPAEDDDLRVAVAVLASDQKIKVSASRGKKSRVGAGMTADKQAAYLNLNVSTSFGAHDLPSHLVTRLHAHHQLIPLFYLTNEALAAAAIPSSEVFKKISNLNVPLDAFLNATLKTSDLHKTLKRFIELWCMEPEGETLGGEELDALDNARQAWIGHLKIVDALVEGTEDKFGEHVTVTYDMEIRAAVHQIKDCRFDPSAVWEPLKQKAQECIQREELSARLRRRRSINFSTW